MAPGRVRVLRCVNGCFHGIAEAHVIDDEQVGLEVFGEHARLARLTFLAKKVAHQVEDRALKHAEARLDRLAADGLGQVAFAHSGRANKEHVASLADKAAGGQLVDLSAVDRGVEAKVKALQGAGVPKVGRLVAPGDHALVAQVDFVQEEQFEELGVGQPVGFSFLEAHFQTAKQPGHAKGLGMGFESVMVLHGRWGCRSGISTCRTFKLDDGAVVKTREVKENAGWAQKSIS